MALDEHPVAAELADLFGHVREHRAPLGLDRGTTRVEQDLVQRAHLESPLEAVDLELAALDLLLELLDQLGVGARQVANVGLGRFAFRALRLEVEPQRIVADAQALEIVDQPDACLVEDRALELQVLPGLLEVADPLLERGQALLPLDAFDDERTIARDPGGNEQESRFWIRWRDYRDENDEPIDDILNKTLVKFKEPFDMKGTAYLMVVRADRAAEQWVYRPSDRRVRRVKMRGGSGVGGTDFSWDDIAFQNVEDADYERLPDEVVRGVPVYVVLAKLKPLKRSRYSKSMVYLEKDHYISLRARHWDHARVEVKELNSEYDSIKRFGDHWVATRGVAQNLQEGTSSSMLIDGLDPDAEIADSMFRTFKLGTTRERLTKDIRGAHE